MNSRPKHVDPATGALTATATSSAPISAQDFDLAPASVIEVDFDYWDVDASTMHTANPARASHIDYEFGVVLDAPRASPARATTATLGLNIEFELGAGWPPEWEFPDFAASTSPGKTYAHGYDYDDNHEYDYEYDFAYDYDYDYDLRFAMEQPVMSTHAVLFFDDEAVRLLEVVNFVCEGVRAGESVFLALTSSIAKSVRAALPSEVLALAERSGGLTILEAQATLELLMRDGTLDPAAFEHYVASGVRRSRKERGPVRVYGEMVTLLWSADNVVAALQLEQLWNELQEEFGVTVLCAYPLALVAEGTEEFARVSQCHNKTIVR